MFLAEGVATGVDPKFYKGHRHALIVILKQAGDFDPDFDRARSVAEQDGWSDVVIDQAASVDLEAQPDPEYQEAIQHAYASAARDGFHVLRFTDPIN